MNHPVEENKLEPPVEWLYGFQPNPGRARFLDKRMRARLADSLRYIFDQADGSLDVPEASFRGFLRRVEDRPVSPLAFSYYCDLVLEIENDNLEKAEACFKELMELPSHTGRADVMDLGDPLTDPVAERYARFVNTDPEQLFEVFAPSRDASKSCRQQIRSAFEMMDAGDPELGSEIRCLLREIILAAGTMDAKAMTFDGASSFMLWGGIIINANRLDGALGMVQMLAHESAHNLLFGLTVDGPLLENGHEERYASPLRNDPRPLEGIYHATFVLARIHCALRNLLASGILSGTGSETAQHDLKQAEILFRQGLETVEKHARLTPAGELIIGGAAAYMAAA